MSLLTRIMYHDTLYVLAAKAVSQSKWVRVIRKRDGKIVQVRRGKETNTKKYKVLKPGRSAGPAKSMTPKSTKSQKRKLTIPRQPARSTSSGNRKHMTRVLLQREQRKQQRVQQEQVRQEQARKEQREVVKKSRGRAKATNGAELPADLQQLSDHAHLASATANSLPPDNLTQLYLAHNNAWDAHSAAADAAKRLGHTALAKWHNHHAAKHEKLQSDYGAHAAKQSKG